QDLFLKNQSLANSSVLQLRKFKKEARDSFLESIKEKSNVKAIAIGEKQVTAATVSQSGEYVVYTLFADEDNKNTIAPSFVTESGYTTDLTTREKVGAAQGNYESFIYNKKLDTTYLIKLDSIPGINDKPDYVKDYPSKKEAKTIARKVWINQTIWNENESIAVVEIRSMDNKDRWLMLLDPSTAKLKLVSRQRDEAWVGGPGTYNTLGWINASTFYFQSEQTGYSHLYTYDITNGITKAITKGNYEVQNAVLSKSKKSFYLLTNEVHPGQQNWYKIALDGSGKEKITEQIGGYEVALSPDEKTIAYRYSFINKPHELFIQENKNSASTTQVTNKAISDEFKQYAWRENKIYTIPARDGQPIYARL
ncbi:MAG: DPP IV N-terminal domain-containing protein, partial [Sediminibacterium sp.]